MLRDLSEGIHREVDCIRVRAWAESTLPEMQRKLSGILQQMGLAERPLTADFPAPDSSAFYTRQEPVWSMLRLVLPELRLPVMDVSILGMTSDCGIKICFDRWLHRSCHESHFSLVLEPRREHRMMVVQEKSVNSPFNKDLLDIDDVVEVLRSRICSSLSMSGFTPATPPLRGGVARQPVLHS